MGGYEIYRKFDNTSSLILERTTVHVSDDTGRIAMLETRTSGTDPSPAELTRYIYSNHLQSASLELNEDAAIISYEEYHPYGTTAYQAMNTSIAAVAKRYRYTGKERDEESGLYYHGARYYIPWLGRWSACDPLENKYAGMSPYNYAFCNPVVWNDLSGMNPRIPPPKSPKESEGALATFISEIYDHNKTLIHYERVDLFIPIENLPKDSSNRGVFLSKTYLGNSKQSNREIEMKVSTNEFRTEYSFQSYDFSAVDLSYSKEDYNTWIPVDNVNKVPGLLNPNIDYANLERTDYSNSFFSKINDWLMAADNFVQGSHHPIIKNKESFAGGDHLSSKKTGTGHSGFTTTNPNSKMTNIDDIISILGANAPSGLSGVLGRLNDLATSVDLFHNAFDNFGVTHQKMAPSKLGGEGSQDTLISELKPKSYTIGVDKSGSVFMLYSGEDTAGMARDYRKYIDSINKVKRSNE